MRKKKIYALYKGDEWITDGTKEELAEYLNVKIRTIDFYTTPVWRKRTKDNAYIVVKLED
ncbi:MAG: hypothetical protein VZS44_09370 [Bacilli bacterium]|nr:hypothetical protein [Bacilli bacterium]